MIMNKNLLLLTLSQVFGFSNAAITVFLGGIIGSQITSIKSLSTLPVASSVVGTAVFTIFCSKNYEQNRSKTRFYFCSFRKLNICFASCFFYLPTKLYFILCLMFNSWYGDGIYSSISFCSSRKCRERKSCQKLFLL